MKFINDKFNQDVEKPTELKFEGLRHLSKKAGLSSVKFVDQTKYAIIAFAPDGEWLPPDDGLKKFLQFTVEECVGVINDAVARRLPASTYADLIKNHFGLGDKNVK